MNTNVPSSFINTPAFVQGGIREDIHRSLYADTEYRRNTPPSLYPAFAIPSDSIPA
ncbi:hypothetical protein [Paenibacillus periandrae]|uniref:hypothetical protein n=1 Tax=Paenibacillus periandrae TaxID=1761741 RepID=UPI001F08FC32|nr:hypothetical protein [Paenibacillus periandrae]